MRHFENELATLTTITTLLFIRDESTTLIKHKQNNPYHKLQSFDLNLLSYAFKSKIHTRNRKVCNLSIAIEMAIN